MAFVADYGKPLREDEVDPDPLRQFKVWFEQAAAAGLRLPEAAALATASADGAPSVRMVLVKGWDERGFVFYSNYASRKGAGARRQPAGSALVPLGRLGRQVRIEGSVEHTSAEESAAYVRSRPRGSQLSALASPQSEVVASRRVLEQRVADLELRMRPSSCRCRRAGAGFASASRRSSSGSSATIACTTGCAIDAAATAAG